jgi:Cu(I)/Ag(I) efflux system membrane fusion protein
VAASQGPALYAQGVREHTRLKGDRSTAVTESQAAELTLTVTEVTVRPIQAWIRTAGRADASRRTITAVLSPAESALVRVGQRVRAFSPGARSLMYQARISQVTRQAGSVTVAASVSGQARQDSDRYVLEIVADHGDLLSVANEAIIETGGARIVYVQQPGGRYAPRDIQIGVQGELYTQVLGGVQAGEQVVTLGSFFVDAERKLKGL